MTGIPRSSEKKFGELRHAVITRLRSVTPCYCTTPHATNLILGPVGPDHVKELARLRPQGLVLTKIVKALEKAQRVKHIGG